MQYQETQGVILKINRNMLTFLEIPPEGTTVDQW